MYSLLCIMASGMTSAIMMVILMELLSWLFISLIGFYLTFKYLLVQSLFFITCLMGVMWMPMLILVSVFLKTGTPPFHLWYINLIYFFKQKMFVFMTTLHKIVPVFFLIKMSNISSLLLAVSMVAVMVAGLFMQMSSLFHVFIVSSMAHSGWQIIACVIGSGFFLLYWLLYSVLLKLFFYSIYTHEVLYTTSLQPVISSLIWLIVSGLPPFTLFWFKLYITSILVGLSLILMVVFILVSVVSLVSYYRSYHLSISTPKIQSYSMSSLWASVLSVGMY